MNVHLTINERAYRNRVETRGTIGLTLESLALENILCDNPELKIYYDIVQSPMDSNNVLPSAMNFALAQAAAQVSHLQGFRVPMRSFHLESFSDARRDVIKKLTDDPKFIALSPMAQFALLASLTFVEEEYLNLDMTEILTRGFNKLTHGQCSLTMDLLASIEVFKYLPSYLDLLATSIDAFVNDDCDEDADVFEKFVEEHFQTAISIAKFILNNGLNACIQSNTSVYLLDSIHTHGELPHVMDLVDDRHIEIANSILSVHSLRNKFAPCTSQHVERIMAGCERNDEQFLKLTSKTLTQLFAGYSASQAELQELKNRIEACKSNSYTLNHLHSIASLALRDATVPANV